MEHYEKNYTGFQKIDGVGSLSDMKLTQPLSINGLGKLRNITTSHVVMINGKTNAYASHFCTLKTNGSIFLETCTVTDKIQCHGSIKAFDCSINAIKLDGVATFNKCSIATLEIEKRHSWIFKYMAHIKLIDTHITGDIIFKGGGGHVTLYGSSTITGNLIGGTCSHKTSWW